MQTSRKKLFIYSSRSDHQQQSQQSHTKFGIERTSFYPFIERRSYNMNYAGLSKAFNEISQLALNKLNQSQKKGDHSFMTKVVKTDWLANVENLLSHARNVATHIEERDSVLIYCPTGNFGSPLLSSLAQIYLEPHYRTFEGFRTLVYKEWIYYRHNFLKESQVLATGPGAENGHSSGRQQEQAGTVFGYKYANLFAAPLPSQKQQTTKQTRPGFLIFLECVAQLARQNPLAFEMNDLFFVHLAQMQFTNRYFEFVQGDDFLDLSQSGVDEAAQEGRKTERSPLVSAFDQLRNKSVYTNAAYDGKDFRELQPKQFSHASRSKLSFDARALVYWAEFFDQFDKAQAAGSGAQGPSAKAR